MEFNQSILFPARSPAMTFAGLQRADSTFSEEFCMYEVRSMMAEPESEEPDYCFSGEKHHLQQVSENREGKKGCNMYNLPSIVISFLLQNRYKKNNLLFKSHKKEIYHIFHLQTSA